MRERLRRMLEVAQDHAEIMGSEVATDLGSGNSNFFTYGRVRDAARSGLDALALREALGALARAAILDDALNSGAGVYRP